MLVYCRECDQDFPVPPDTERARATCPGCGESVRLPRHRRDEDDRPRRRSRPRRRARSGMMIVLGLGGVGLAFLLGGVALAIGLLWRTPFRPEAFRPHMGSYVGFVLGPAPPGTRVGKLVVVDARRADFDRVMEFLPPAMRPGSPEEVATVAQLRWSETTVGRYTGGGAANQWACDVTVFDLKTRGVIARQQFVGSRPPDSFRSRVPGASRSGTKPTEEVLAYLERLFRS